MPKALLIDGDVVAYRAAAVHQDAWKTEEDVSETVDHLMKSILGKYLWEPIANENYFVYLTGKGNFRYDLHKDYKANRKGTVRPKFLPYARDYLVQEDLAVVIEGAEADDAIATKANSMGYDVVVVSNDKDFRQLPCVIFDFTKGIEHRPTPEEASRFFYTQCLTGDTVDNIKGVKGIGPKKAEKMLEGLTTDKQMWDAVLEAHGCYDKALTDARLLWLQREEGELWEPPND